MSYTVLARKWRPAAFEELVGQDHVQRALVNAIEHDRLHHAYLFTGTRGVGKTTIARIFSKCLNCETGITAKPCGECAVCQEIDQGHFVDLIEVDAASRTKVEDTREILDNVQYRPTRGRYKVYLIDEVHMLSNSSFNALLKTLEEPPPHVVFLLATTDPQKLPVTVLSRCLQFHLKRMTQPAIIGHLEHILTQESISFEPESLSLVARAADGSMRDALSLLDQAIAFGAGKLEEQDVAEMLGAIDQRFVIEYLDAFAEQDAVRMLEITERMAEFAPDYQNVLADIISALHRIAVLQLVGPEPDDMSALNDYAERFSQQDVQLFYQLAITARKDLGLSPDPRQGFEMALLRMLAFQPATSELSPAANRQAQKKKPELNSRQQDNHKKPVTPVELIEQNKPLSQNIPAEQKQSTASAVAPSESRSNQASGVADNQPLAPTPAVRESSTVREPSSAKELDIKREFRSEKEPETVNSVDQMKAAAKVANASSSKQETSFADQMKTDRAKADSRQESQKSWENKTQHQIVSPAGDLLQEGNLDNQQPNLLSEPASTGGAATETITFALRDLLNTDNWYVFINQLGLTGRIFQVVNNSCVDQVNDSRMVLSLLPSVEHFCSDSTLKAINEAISRSLNSKIIVTTTLGDDTLLTPRIISEQKHQQRLQDKLREYLENPKVAGLLDTFSAELTVADIKLH